MAIWGIDLGTTNSLIGCQEKGYLSEIVPSCVNMDTREAGASQFENMKALRSFKIDISMGIEGITSRLASRIVLEELKRIAERDTGDVVDDVVISVPAYFSDSQRTATLCAASDAGMNVKGLVNEPTAAAIYIAKEKKGLFIVYDLGGGTFDCSIIDSRFGSYDVQATSGRVVGGDNLDTAILKNFVKMGKVPLHHLNEEQHAKLKHLASKVKVQMQKTRAPFEVNLREFGGEVYLFTPDTYVGLMKLVFSDTIELMKSLQHKWIPSTEIFEVLLVGGSTHCPYLREWIADSTGVTPAELTYDPDRVVAQGAALYAQLLEQDAVGYTVSDVTKALSVGLEDGTVGVVVPANSKIPLTMERSFTNPTEADSLKIDLYQGESMFASDNECIGTLIWEYEETQPAGLGDVIVKISIDKDGMITFSVNELLREPKIVVLRRKD